jgi:membrane protein
VTTRARPLALLVQAARRYVADGMLERAPALAYYGILSLFPMLLIGTALVRLVAGSGAASDLARYARDQGASSALADTVRSAVETAQAASTGAAGTAGLVGFVTLVYGASRAFTAAGRALDAVAHRASARRSPLRRAEDLGWTLVVLVMALVLLVLTLLSGQVLRAIADARGIGGHTAWTIARWVALMVTALLIVAVVRWAAPTGGRPPFRLVSSGTVLSVGALLVATRGFDFYVSTIATYNTTYGAFAGAVILILWLWLAAGTFLLGAELDAVCTPPSEAGAPPCRSTVAAGQSQRPAEPRRTA